MWALSYTDHITMACPCLYGKNFLMLDICNDFSRDNYYRTFDTKKYV